MVKWLLVIVVIVSGAILAYFNFELKKVESTSAPTPIVEEEGAIRINHSFSDGVHRYTGQIKLPHSCFSIRTEMHHETKNGDHATLSIITKDNILNEPICAQISTRYPFETIMEGPEYLELTLQVDDVVRPIRVTETAWTNPTGTIINN